MIVDAMLNQYRLSSLHFYAVLAHGASTVGPKHLLGALYGLQIAGANLSGNKQNGAVRQRRPKCVAWAFLLAPLRPLVSLSIQALFTAPVVWPRCVAGAFFYDNKLPFCCCGLTAPTLRLVAHR